jgi:hypothetical protein
VCVYVFVNECILFFYVLCCRCMLGSICRDRHNLLSVSFFDFSLDSLWLHARGCMEEC